MLRQHDWYTVSLLTYLTRHLDVFICRDHRESLKLSGEKNRHLCEFSRRKHICKTREKRRARTKTVGGSDCSKKNVIGSCFWSREVLTPLWWMATGHHARSLKRLLLLCSLITVSSLEEQPLLCFIALVLFLGFTLHFILDTFFIFLQEKFNIFIIAKKTYVRKLYKILTFQNEYLWLLIFCNTQVFSFTKFTDMYLFELFTQAKKSVKHFFDIVEKNFIKQVVFLIFKKRYWKNLFGS